MSAVRRNTITDVTRQDILDFLSVGNIEWAGRLEETAFLGRIWDLSKMPSTDFRFSDAAGDIWQHRVNNPQDWADDWVFHDERFLVLHADDALFTRFLAEMLHPVVRPDVDESRRLASDLNESWFVTTGSCTRPASSPANRFSPVVSARRTTLHPMR